MSKTATLVLAAIVAALAAGAWWWRTQQPSEPPVAVAPPAAPASAPVAAAPAASEPAIRYPVEPPAAAPLAADELPAALATLLGRKAVSTFFQTDDFARRFVATVDNLGRAHAPAIVWPVTPTAGRFTVEEADGSTAIAADNSSRYTPFVLLVETVDTGRAVELYVRMYPLLQQAYEALGYPGKYFNDRLVQVIDLLLATPEVSYPVKLHLTEVKGPIPSERPWVRYEYADPALEKLAAGQKILLRVGPVNARRLKAKLAEARSQLTKTPPTR
jgi:hypothetical protein